MSAHMALLTWRWSCRHNMPMFVPRHSAPAAYDMFLITHPIPLHSLWTASNLHIAVLRGLWHGQGTAQMIDAKGMDPSPCTAVPAPPQWLPQGSRIS